MESLVDSLSSLEQKDTKSTKVIFALGMDGRLEDGMESLVDSLGWIALQR